MSILFLCAVSYKMWLFWNVNFWGRDFFTLHKKWSFPLWISTVNLRIWSYLRKKSLMENFIFCVVSHNSKTSSILVRKLKFLKKMVVSSAKSTTTISWSPICMPIIFVLTSIKIESTSATIMLKSTENGQSWRNFG